MSNIKPSRNSGSLVISEEVIASIAVTASKDVEGVRGFASRPLNVKKLCKDSASKHVEVEIQDTEIRIHIYLKVASDAKIPQLCENVQRNIKNAVQNMTGSMVSAVDITIATIDIDEAPKKSKK